MEELLGELLRRLVWGAVGAGVERLVEGATARAPQLTLADIQGVSAIRHQRGCACPNCDDRFILGLDDDDD